jgi:hypothetical protein
MPDLARLSRTTAKLDGLPGLVGALSGVRRKGRRWTAEPTLTLLIRRKIKSSKLPRDERIPRKLDGIATDVVPIGRPRAYADVDTADRLVASHDTSDRKSAMSVLAEHPNGGMVALGSGHGLLPVANGAYLRGRWTTGQTPVDVLGATVRGSLWFGRVGQDADFAVVRFPALVPPEALPGHTLAPAPIPIAANRIATHDGVQHVASRRGFRITGRVVAETIPGQPIRLRSDAGVVTAYHDVAAVTGESVRFSLPGESGSLVFDEQREAVGFVIGGGVDPDHPDRDVTFVLRDFAPLEAELAQLFGRFFTRSQS